MGRLLKVDRKCFRCGRSSQANVIRISANSIEYFLSSAFREFFFNIERLRTLAPAAGAFAASKSPTRG
jgi:hypothetical protein